MKVVLRHITLIVMAIVLVAVAIQSVSADPDDLDDYIITHHNNTGHPAGELQHVHTLHFDNQAYIHLNRQICFGNSFSTMRYACLQDLSEFSYTAFIWQPPQTI